MHKYKNDELIDKRTDRIAVVATAITMIGISIFICALFIAASYFILNGVGVF